MHYLKVQFKNPRLEESYQDECNERKCDFHFRQRWLLFFMALTFTISAIVVQNFLYLGFTLATSLTLVLRLRQFQQFTRFHDYFLIVIALLINSAGPVQNYLGMHNTYNNYTHGCFMTYLTLALINYLKYQWKIFIITYIYVINLIFTTNAEAPLWTQYVTYVFFSALYAQLAYYDEKAARGRYIKTVQISNLNDLIASQNQIEGFVCSLDKLKANIELQQFNSSFQSFNMALDRIEQYLQDMVIVLTNFQLQTSVLLKKKLKKGTSINFRYFLMYLLQDHASLKNIQEISRKEQLHILEQLAGYVRDVPYKVSIRIIENNELEAVIIISKNSIEQNLQEKQHAISVLENELEYFSRIFDLEIKMCLVYFKWIYSVQDRSKNIKLINKTLKIVYSKLLKSFNDYKNMKEFHQYQQTQQNQLTSLQWIVEEQIQMIHYYHTHKLITTKVINKLSDNMILSNKPLLQQLFLNLFFLITRSSDNLTVILEDQDKHPGLKDDMVRVSIQYQGPPIEKGYLDSLPIIKPVSLRECKHNASKDLKLELCVALLIVRLLGPEQKITIKIMENSTNAIVFKLYKHLPPEFELATISSFAPKDYIHIRANRYSTDDKERIQQYRSSISPIKPSLILSPTGIQMQRQRLFTSRGS